MALGGPRRDSHPTLGVRRESWRFPREGMPEMGEERSYQEIEKGECFASRNPRQ